MKFTDNELMTLWGGLVVAQAVMKNTPKIASLIDEKITKEESAAMNVLEEKIYSYLKPKNE